MTGTENGAKGWAEAALPGHRCVGGEQGRFWSRSSKTEAVVSMICEEEISASLARVLELVYRRRMRPMSFSPVLPAPAVPKASTAPVSRQS